MGEYAIRKSDKQEIKIGTCESMYYLRYQDIDKIIYEVPGFDLKTANGLYWRLPFPDEDNCLPGADDYHAFGYERGQRLSQAMPDGYSINYQLVDCEPGWISIHHKSGLVVGVLCYHGEKLPEDIQDKVTFGWNGKNCHVELVSLKKTIDGFLPVVRCTACNNKYSTDWNEIKDYIHGELKTRIEKMINGD